MDIQSKDPQLRASFLANKCCRSQSSRLVINSGNSSVYCEFELQLRHMPVARQAGIILRRSTGELRVPRKGFSGLPGIFVVAILAVGCGGSSDDGVPPPSGGGTPPPTPVVGPPPPVIVDESGVPASSDAGRIALTDVTVVPMDRDTVIPNQTVLVEDGRIAWIEDAATAVVPAAAERLDGTGRYLMPGLIDMHAHLMTEAGAEHDLILELAAGVTTVRIMWGSEGDLRWRDQIGDGAMLGPSLFVASPGLEGNPPYWPGSVVVESDAEARDAVRSMHAAGYDFLKVYNRLQLAPYLAILDEADAVGLRVVGHVPQALTADFAIDSGQHSIEHFSRYAAEVTTTGGWTGEIDGSRLAALIDRLRLAGTWSCPTLTVQVRKQSQVAGIKANPLYALVSEPMREWLDSNLTQPSAADRTAEDATRRKLLKELDDAGIPVLVGTDTGVLYVLPGFSIHEELQAFAEAGLTPYRVLRAATISAAAALDRSDRGAVVAGMRADLLLLDSNPLTDVGNVNRRVGVMVNGRWFAQSTLMDMARSAQ
jgi:imidazolonepropionase-like amidohydrolase